MSRDYAASGAVTWADNHAKPGFENCALSPCLQNDCAAFVSQVLWWGGGYAMTQPTTTNIHDHHYWWKKNVGAGFGYTDSWGGANALYNFQQLHSPGGTFFKASPGSTTTALSGLAKGDLFFYDWNNDSYKDHVSIHVGYGTDPQKGRVGDYVDQHSTGSPAHYYHGFWSSFDYNVNWRTTTIYLIRISSLN
jgi:hypothetical protein